MGIFKRSRLEKIILYSAVHTILPVFLLVIPSLGCADISLNKTPLTSVAGLTNMDASPDPDDPGGGGGIDSETYFHTLLLPKIGDCTIEIEKSIISWTKDHSLLIFKKESIPGKILLHATNSNLKGFFEFIYRVDAKRERTRVTLFFYSADGERHEPLGIKRLLKDYKVDFLQDQLQAALLCQTI